MGYMYGPQWGMMGGWGGYGFGLVHMAVWIVVVIAIIGGIVGMVRSMSRAGDMPARRSPGLDVLEERYARGEINRDEFMQKKRDIAG